MSKNKLRTLALSLALATGAAGFMQVGYAADAQPATAAAAPADSAAHASDKHRHRHEGKHAPMARPGFGPGAASPLAILPRLKERLALTDSQQTVWRAAESQGQEARKAMREQRLEDRKALRQQLAAGPLDLRALDARQEAARATVQPRLKAARDAWLVAYDSLDAKQKQVVTDAFKRSLKRGERHHGHREGGKPAPK